MVDWIRKQIGWVANASQSLIAAIVLTWGVFHVAALLGSENNLNRFWALIAALVFVVPMLYALLCNAVLIGLRGVGIIAETEGFEAVGKRGKRLQIKVLEVIFAMTSILTPFALLGVFNGHRTAYLISLGAFVFVLSIVIPLCSDWLQRNKVQ